MRKLYTITVGIFLTLLFAACTQFTADIEDVFLSYWSTEVAITRYSFDPAITVHADKDTIESIPSLRDVTVTLTVRNPKNVKFQLPQDAGAPADIVVFPADVEGTTTSAPKQPDDYELTQDSPSQLTLKYKAVFLQKHEYGKKNIGPTITLYPEDGRKFSKTFTLNVKANTPPPKPTFAVAKTTGTPSYYVLCITVPETDMSKTVAGGLLHKDLAHVEINETPYSFSVNEAEKKFVKPEADAFIGYSDVEKLTAPDADKVPSGGWVLYYKTDAEVKDGAAKSNYTIKLIDAEGLVSGELKASTKPNRPAPVHISLVKGICTADVNNDNTGTTPHTIGVGESDKPATLRLTSATANATISYTLTEISTGSTASPSTGSGAGSGLDIPLPIQTGKTEAEYMLTVRAEADGFETGAERTLYYKITAQNTDTALSALKLTEGSDVYSAALIAGSDSAYICKIPFAERARTLTLTATTANSRSTITAVTVNGTPPAGFAPANTVTLMNAVTLPSTLPAAQVTVKITVTGEDPSVSKEYTLTVAYPPVLTSLSFSSGGTPVSFRNEGDTVDKAFSSHTFEYYIFAAQLSPSVMDFTAAPESGATVTVSVNGNNHTGATVPLPGLGGEMLVTFTVAKDGLQNEYTVRIKRKSYTVTFKAQSSDDEESAGGGKIQVTNPAAAGIASVSGNNSAVVTVKAETGTTITVSATAETNYRFKRWSKGGTPIGTGNSYTHVVDSSATIQAELISPNIYVRGTNGDWYTAHVQGAAAGNDSTGNGSKQKPYATVTKALQARTEAGVPYTIWADGIVEEQNTLTIGSGETVTIAALRKDYDPPMPAILQDGRPNPTVEQCLVTTAGTLTLDGIALEGIITGLPGTPSVTSGQNAFGIKQTGGAVTAKGENMAIKNFSHGVKIKGGTFTMEAGSICNNYSNGNSGVDIRGGAFILNGGSIKANEATNVAGVYVKGATFTMNNGEISGNKAWCLGGGIYVDEYGIANISGGTIKANHAAQSVYVGGSKDVGGGGIYVGHDGTVNFTAGTIEGNIIHEVEKNCGAGVFIGEKGTFNMSGGTINDCTTEIPLPDGFGTPVPSEPSRGVGVYVAGDSEPTKGTFNMTGGIIINCKPRSGHTADGGGVYVGREAVFRMKGYADVTPSTGSDANVKGNNDVYLDDKMITVDGVLSPAGGIAARITVSDTKYNTSTQVLTGSTVNTEHTKFTVTPKTVSGTTEEWGIDSNGKLKKAKTIDGGDSDAWEELKTAVQSAANGDVITIKGTVKATNALGNSGEIVINGKNITIKGAEGAGTAELNANSNYPSPPGAPTKPHRIFKVTNGTLTLKNLTLKNGNAGKLGSELDSSGGGILLESGSVSLSGVTISGCKAITTGPSKGQGGGIYIKSGTLTMDNSELSTNEATKAGGGVYIASNGIFNLIGGQLSSNVISNDPKQGIAVYNDNGTFKWTGGTITNHHAGSDDTVIAGPYTNTSGNAAD